jgi:hypothetical protein
MKQVPCKVFDGAAGARGSDEYNKRLDSWGQLVAIIYPGLRGAPGLCILNSL